MTKPVDEQKPVFTNICIGGPLDGTQYQRPTNGTFFEVQKAEKVQIPQLEINGAAISRQPIFRYEKAEIENHGRIYYYWLLNTLTPEQGAMGLLGKVLDILTKMQGG